MNTSLGHMHQQQKNVQYTRRQSTINITAPEPPLEPLPVSTHHVHANNFNTAGKIYIDLLRRFLILPNIGNCYLFILYDYNSNATFTEPIKNCSNSKVVGAYTKIVNHLTEHGFKPQLQLLDNEAPTALKNKSLKNYIAYQLVPPYTHQRMAEE